MSSSFPGHVFCLGLNSAKTTSKLVFCATRFSLITIKNMEPATKKAKQESKFRAYCFTFHDYDTIGEKRDILEDKYDYIVVGKEVCPTTGRKHLQGYVYWKHAKTWNASRKLLQKAMPACHVEIRSKDSTNEQAINYCKKDGDFEESGTPPMENAEKGKKGEKAEKDRWNEARANAVIGNFDAIPSDIYIRCLTNLKMIHRDNMKPPPDLDDVCGIWIWGPPGTGKSHSARNDYGPFYLKETNKWWDSYRNEETVVVEEVELDAGKYIGHFLKKWADRYAFDCEVKGSKLIIRPQRIVVTSNYSIEDVFMHDNTMMQAIKRRFVVIYKDQVYEKNAQEGGKTAH